MNTKQLQSNTNKITFENFDKLKLKSFAENLFQIMEKRVASSMGEQGAYTISLNAEFGNGKTTFLKMFESFIKKEKQNYNVLFINAWESDFCKEPVIAILSELICYIEKNSIKYNLKKIIQSIGRVGINISDQIINQIIEKVTKVSTALNLNVEKLEEDLGQSIFDNFYKRKESIEDIKTIVTTYTKNKKFLIIVDELDRTRPDYAVHFLEDMKHFFDIENVIFLVAVNREQMEATVKCLYGQDLNFNGYYRKFFKQELYLPHLYKEKENFKYSHQKVQKFIKGLLDNINLNNIEYLCSTQKIYFYCAMFGLTLREIKVFIEKFKIILESKQENINQVYIDCYLFFIGLFMKEIQVFKSILSSNYKVSDLLTFFEGKNIINLAKQNQYSEPLVIDLLKIVSSSLMTIRTNKPDLYELKKMIIGKEEILKSPMSQQLTIKCSHIEQDCNAILEDMHGTKVKIGDYSQFALIICEKINQLMQER